MTTKETEICLGHGIYDRLPRGRDGELLSGAIRRRITEVRKQDEELIRQLVKALKSAQVWKSKEMHHIMKEILYTPALEAALAAQKGSND